ncbi:PPR domain-containing protein/PPR_2 domain-containing protein [Cephalotus follicularis]|uniref:PPR domain-containing protein/PPR_2 domain-containing protein n=1 Tax=Cephalotus follicularis TaxID=3775 RepID=A0A1Q3BZM2_CEPFO|nr:PPR domain-containing protein/PPR_2 domain-containing protein [Cephalotus follicularis]
MFHSVHHGRAVHAKLIKGSISSFLFLQNHLLNLYVKSGDLANGYKLFEEMPHRNVVSWSAIIAGFVKHGYPSQALSLFGLMHRDGTTMPNEFTLVSALHASSLSDNLTQAYQIYAFVVRLGFQFNIFLNNAFLTVLIRHGRLEDALEVFEKFPNKDIVSWNAMMAGYLQYSCLEVPALWFRMMREGVKPDNFTFASILTGLAALSDLKMGLRVHAQIVKGGHGGEICIGNSLVDFYIKNEKLADAFLVFHEMPLHDVCSWTQIAAGCVTCGEPGKALEAIAQMKEMGVRPNKFTLATALNACANLASLQEGERVHGLRIKLGTEIDVRVDNALLDMYAKCGCLDAAWCVFRSLRNRSVVSWTTMITCCAQNGQVRKALEIFEEMKGDGVQPNHITFICVLYACGQGGFIDEGWKYFSMIRDYGISPGEDHYVCMVNLLGRAGHIKEAEELIVRMPSKPGVLVWQTLLGACIVHGDLETAKRAAGHVMDLDRKDPSTYVLLSNMFAGMKNWDHVDMLRDLMDSRNVKKMPGSSWIELEESFLPPPALQGFA